MYDFVVEAKENQMFPALCFQLDLFKCLGKFKELLVETERRQQLKYPDYYKDLHKKMLEMEKMKAANEKRSQTKEEEEEDAKDGLDEVSQKFIDVTAPHPEYVFSPPTLTISAKEFSDIRDELKDEIKSPDHAFLRALRRGIGIYVDDLFYYRYR